ncbi:hypothetical protein ACFQ4G_09705, partial [Methylobacterium marchantiae]
MINKTPRKTVVTVRADAPARGRPTLPGLEPTTERVSDGYRWGQLVIGVICMVMIANLQYG